MSSIVMECKEKLLQLKAELLNRARSAKRELEMFEAQSGDEADQTMSIMAENEFLTHQQRIKEQLLEVELALARIAAGRYGICEETDEQIEPERLRALPWTRVSIEGAELREAMKKKYAR